MVLGCVLAGQAWFMLLSSLGLASLTPDGEVSLGPWWLCQRKRRDSAAQPFFDSMFLLVAWILWKERNSVAFERSVVSDAFGIYKAVAAAADEWALAGFDSTSLSATTWSQFFGPM